MIEIELSERVDFDRVGELWSALESRADGSFFQSWPWVGCLAGQRYPDPVLLQARQDGVPLALGLFNRRRRLGQSDLLLNESGVAGYDAVFVEHNGFLVERGRADDLAAACLRALTDPPAAARRLRHRLILSGVPQTYIAAAQAGPQPHLVRATRPAPFVDLLALRQSGRQYLNQLSSNARYQLRRSQRRFAAVGPLTLDRAGTVAQARDFLARLAALHQKYWTGRGRPGAFANADFLAFHHALIERAFASAGIDLLRVSAGAQAIGYLYNFRYRGSVYAYQSGFDYSAADSQQKPGLTCHHLAIEQYLADGADRYDFLAGDARYKISLASGAVPLYWLEIGQERPFSAWRDRVGAIIGRQFRRGGRSLVG